MKIVQINTECERGSTGKIVMSISKLLTKNEVENYIFYSGNHKTKNRIKNGVQINSKFELRIHQLLGILLGNQGWHSYFTTKKMIKKIVAINPDVIHLHNIHGYYLHMRVLFDYLSKCNSQIIWTMHDCWAFTGHCAHFVNENCSKWKNGCNNCPRKHKYPYSIFKDNSKILYERKKRLFTSIKNMIIVTPSVWLANLIKESFLNEYRIEIINNGIDINIFKPNLLEKSNNSILNNNKKIILGVASVWGYGKGLDVFVDLCGVLDNKNYQIVIVGTTKEIDKVLPKSIVSIHRTSNQIELAKLYNAAHLFLNPTREDTYPTVNMESISCGTPVITFNTGGSPEILNNKYGCVVKSNTLDELVKKIYELEQNYDSYANLCKCSSKYFNQDNFYQKYIDLYILVSRRER